MQVSLLPLKRALCTKSDKRDKPMDQSVSDSPAAALELHPSTGMVDGPFHVTVHSLPPGCRAAGSKCPHWWLWTVRRGQPQPRVLERAAS
jgi:hypothetical protein